MNPAEPSTLPRTLLSAGENRDVGITLRILVEKADEVAARARKQVGEFESRLSVPMSTQAEVDHFDEDGMRFQQGLMYYIGYFNSQITELGRNVCAPHHGPVTLHADGVPNQVDLVEQPGDADQLRVKDPMMTFAAAAGKIPAVYETDRSTVERLGTVFAQSYGNYVSRATELAREMGGSGSTNVDVLRIIRATGEFHAELVNDLKGRSATEGIQGIIALRQEQLPADHLPGEDSVNAMRGAWGPLPNPTQVVSQRQRGKGEERGRDRLR